MTDVFTPRDELEHVRSFDRQLADAAVELQTEAEAVRCDSCGGVVDQVAEPGRWRHRSCIAPDLPPVAVEVLERLRARREQNHVDA